MSAHPIIHITALTDPKDCVAILSALTVLGNREGPFTLEKLQTLVAVEAHFRHLLRREQHGYFNALGDPARKVQNDAFAKNMQLIHSHLASAFQRYVMRSQAWLDHGAHTDLLHRATALAVANFAALVKWSYFLHETLKGTSWSELHALYYFAEQQGFHQKALKIYDIEDGFHPSIETLYLSALMLDIINPGSLSAAQIEIAEGWLAEWCADYSLETEYQPRSHLMYVDIAEHSGFHLATPGVHGETLRYLRADALRLQIEEVKSELRNGHRYEGHGSGHEFPVEEHGSLLSSIERLYQSILARSGNRIEERTQVQHMSMDVVVGFEAILATLGAVGAIAEPDRGGAEGEAEIPRSWKIHDFSSAGFGLLIDRAAAERVALQSLIAMRKPGEDNWAIGSIVRKLTNRVQGQTLFGVEVLSYRPMRVALRRFAQERPGADETFLTGRTEGIYVPGKDNDGRRDFLVLRPRDFAAKHVFEIPARDAHYRIRLNRAVKKGADWIALRFEVDNKR